MTYIIAITMLVLNGILGHIKKYGKSIALLLSLFMWTLFWSNSMNPDHHVYLYQYRSMQLGALIFDGSGHEIGYRALMKLAAYLGLSFEAYLAILTACSYMLIHSTIRRYCKNYNYVYVLYFIFPYFLDVVQIRNFLAMSIFIFSVRFLIDDVKRPKLKFTLLILVASTIHYTAILYLPMLLIKMRKKNFLIRGIVIFSIFGSLIILINNKQIPFIGIIVQSIFKSDKVLNWFNQTTNFGFLIFWFMQVISFLMLFYARYLTKDMHKEIISLKDKKLVNTEKEIRFVEVVYWINLLAFIYFPFYLLASTFTRLMRNLMILNFISFAIVNGIIRRREKKLLFNISVFLYVLFFFLFELFIPYKDSVIDAILKNNLFMGR